MYSPGDLLRNTLKPLYFHIIFLSNASNRFELSSSIKQVWLPRKKMKMRLRVENKIKEKFFQLDSTVLLNLLGGRVDDISMLHERLLLLVHPLNNKSSSNVHHASLTLYVTVVKLTFFPHVTRTLRILMKNSFVEFL